MLPDFVHTIWPGNLKNFVPGTWFTRGKWSLSERVTLAALRGDGKNRTKMCKAFPCLEEVFDSDCHSVNY